MFLDTPGKIHHCPHPEKILLTPRVSCLLMISSSWFVILGGFVSYGFEIQMCQNIRVRAGKVLGVVQRIFAWIFPNFPKKYLGHFLSEYFLLTLIFGMTSKRKKKSSCDSAHIERHFVQVKVHRAPFTPVFSGSLPRFSWILQRLSHILPRFVQIFPGFSPNQNFWGLAWNPFTHASYTSVLKHINNHNPIYSTAIKICLICTYYIKTQSWTTRHKFLKAIQPKMDATSKHLI